MSIVPDIFAAFGGVNKLASATGSPQQTASSWLTRDPPDIPVWRRPVVLDAARREAVELPPSALAYLTSTTRTAKARDEARAA